MENNSTTRNRVFVHVKPDKDSEWRDNTSHTFLRLPVVGEYIALENNGNSLYRVEVVLHCPNGIQYVAEIFAIGVEGGIVSVLTNIGNQNNL
jgi:hypothetical protein